MLRALGESRVEWLVGDQQHIGRDHLPRVALQAQTHPVRQKAHAGQRRHGQHEREQQQRQFPGQPVRRAMRKACRQAEKRG
jgi:hypothetical protein